jgi:two-component system nitrate/nitrite response regulator NarL
MSKHTRSISVVVADDHPVVLSGLISLLKKDKAFGLVASCGNGMEVIDAVRALKPDLALVDVNMSELNGLQVLKTLVSENLPTRIVLLAATLSDREIVAASKGGAYGIVLKESAADTLLACLHAVADGKQWLPAALVDGAIERTREYHERFTRLSERLTPREIEIMLRVAEGLPNREVGRQLNISEGTVKMHLHNIYEKVGVRNRTSLANFATVYSDQLGSS